MEQVNEGPFYKEYSFALTYAYIDEDGEEIENISDKENIFIQNAIMDYLTKRKHNHKDVFALEKGYTLTWLERMVREIFYAYDHKDPELCLILKSKPYYYLKNFNVVQDKIDPKIFRVTFDVDTNKLSDQKAIRNRMVNNGPDYEGNPGNNPWMIDIKGSKKCIYLDINLKV